MADPVVRVGWHAGASAVAAAAAAVAASEEAVAAASVAAASLVSNHEYPSVSAWMGVGSRGDAGAPASVHADRACRACLANADRGAGCRKTPMSGRGKALTHRRTASASHGGVPMGAPHGDSVHATNQVVRGRKRHAGLALWASSRIVVSATMTTKASWPLQSLPSLPTTGTGRRRSLAACALAVATPSRGVAVAPQRS